MVLTLGLGKLRGQYKVCMASSLCYRMLIWLALELLSTKKCFVDFTWKAKGLFKKKGINLMLI